MRTDLLNEIIVVLEVAEKDGLVLIGRSGSTKVFFCLGNVVSVDLDEIRCMSLVIPIKKNIKYET